MENEYMNTKFFSQLEFQGKRAVIDWCIKVGLMSSFFICDKCGEKMVLKSRNDISDGYNWICRRNGPNKHLIKKSVRQGSCFERCKLDLITMLTLTLEWVFGASHDFMCQDQRVSKQTVTDWMVLCREVCMCWAFQNPQAIGGDSVVIEIDECKLDRRKCHKSMKVEGEWVYRGLEKGTNNCFFVVVSDCNEETLLSVLQKYVLPETTIVSNCWKKYDCLLHESFEHFRVNHSVTFENSAAGSEEAYAEMNSFVWESIWRRTYKEKCLSELMKEFLRTIVAVYPPNSEDGQRTSLS